MRYSCPLCGYVYDEEKEGVKFADLPDDWRCPVCGEPKEDFLPSRRIELRSRLCGRAACSDGA